MKFTVINYIIFLKSVLKFDWYKLLDSPCMEGEMSAIHCHLRFLNRCKIAWKLELHMRQRRIYIIYFLTFFVKYIEAKSYL
jgi:hypothetical protein